MATGPSELSLFAVTFFAASWIPEDVNFSIERAIPAAPPYIQREQENGSNLKANWLSGNFVPADIIGDVCLTVVESPIMEPTSNEGPDRIARRLATPGPASPDRHRAQQPGIRLPAGHRVYNTCHDY